MSSPLFDALLPPPTTDPAPLSNMPSGQTNLLHRTAWDNPANPLKVRFDPWENSAPTVSDPEKIQVFLDGVEIGFKEWTAPISPTDLFVPIPADKLPPGEHRLTYRVTIWSGTPHDSDPFTITVDKDAPVLNASSQLVFPSSALPPNKITDVYLKANDEKIKVDLPLYSAPSPWDRIEWFWGQRATDFNSGGVIELNDTNYTQPVTFEILGQLVRDRGDGTRFVQYRVLDRAGNPSVYSTPVELDVSATPIPRTLPPSAVKEATGGASSGVLTPSAAINGVTVTIPSQAVIYPDEDVFVQWAEPGTVGEYRTNTPVAPGSLDYRIPKEKMAQHLGKTLPVYYEVFERGVEKPHESNRYSLRVEELTGMPTVQCDRVSGGRLSLASVTTGFANFTLASWTLMALDQYLTVTVEGMDTNSQKLVISVLTGAPVPEVAQVISVGRISKSDLERFKLNIGFEVRVKVSFDNEQSWKSFPLLTPTLVA
jgi:hypothetical protein